MKKGIIENKEYLEVYECLRQAHSAIKDIWHLPNEGRLSETMNMAIENVHHALYLAEKISMNEAYPQPL